MQKRHRLPVRWQQQRAIRCVRQSQPLARGTQVGSSTRSRGARTYVRHPLHSVHSWRSYSHSCRAARGPVNRAWAQRRNRSCPVPDRTNSNSSSSPFPDPTPFPFSFLFPLPDPTHWSASSGLNQRQSLRSLPVRVRCRGQSRSHRVQ